MSFSPGQTRARQALNGPARSVCIVGGTRSGKTFLIMRNIIVRALKAPMSRHAALRFRGNAARATIALDTLPNVVARCFPGLSVKEHRQDGFFELPNKSQIWIGGLDDKKRVEKILGSEFATMFLNESSQISYEAATLAFTRVAQVVPGIRQKIYVDLNPVGKGHWTNRMFGDKVDPVSGKALPPHLYDRAFLNPYDNAANLSQDFLDSLEALPEKARKRFLEGKYVDDVEGALWTLETIEKCRVDPSEIPEEQRDRVVIAIDPSGAARAEDKRSDEIGIVAAAASADLHAYILEDLTIKAAPEVWARRAVDAYHRLRADCIVAERNFGGDMVRAVIHGVDDTVPVRMVTASRGKSVRAEPIATLYTKGYVHHVGRLSKLEDQLQAFSTYGYTGERSPDRADACVWAVTELLLEDAPAEAAVGRYQTRS